MTSRLKKELLQLQLQRKNKNDSALVFEQAKVNLRKLWTAAYAEAGVPKGTRLFYSVRHNFGTEMANEGMPLPALANLLGHSDVKMTMRYYNMNKKTIDKARDILNRRAVINSGKRRLMSERSLGSIRATPRDQNSLESFGCDSRPS